MKRGKQFLTITMAAMMWITAVVPTWAVSPTVQAQPVNASRAAENEEVTVYFKEDFEYTGDKADYFVSNWTAPKGIAVANNAGTTVKAATDENNKVLNITGSSAEGSKAFQVDARWGSETTWNDSTSYSDLSEKIVVYEMDIKLQEEPTGYVTAQLRSIGTSGAAFSVLFKIENNVLKGEGLTNQTLTSGWHNIAVVCDFAKSTRDVYLDDKLIGDDLAIHNAANFNAEKVNDYIRFNYWKAVDTDIFIDDLFVYEGEEPIELPKEDSGSGDGSGDQDEDPVEITEGRKIFSTDLEFSNPLVLTYHDNILEWISETGNEDNKVLRFERKNGTDFHVDLKGIHSDAASVVYDFDLKLVDAAKTYFVVQLKDDNANYSMLCKIANNGVLYDGTGQKLETAALKDNEWINIAVVYNYSKGERSIYINGTLVKSGIAIEPSFGGADIASTLRFYCPNLKDILGTEEFDVDEHHAEFMIDNIRVYEGSKPCEELTEQDVVINIEPGKSIFTEEKYNGKYATSQYDTLLNGYICLHTRSGMVYNNGVKTLLETTPVAAENGYFVAVEEICTVLGVSYSINGTTVTINGKTADNAKISTITSGDKKKAAIDAQYFFETILGKVVTVDQEAKSDGMMIAGSTAFTWPTENYDSDSVFSGRTDLQNLNDYLLFERPTAETIKEKYEASDLSGAHPRIQMTDKDIIRIKEEIQKNSLMTTWYQQLIAAADYLVEESTDALKYELRDGVRLLYVSRDMLDHMYTLGMAYQLTGDQKYVDRAWVDLYAVSEFKDWHPEHDLDPAEMVTAVAIGYDWMYSGLSETQRETIEKAVYKNCFYDATMAYQSSSGKLGGAVLSGINHNIVLNGSFAIGAMAFMDVYPEVSSYILSGAVRAADIMLTEYGPDGAWKEGPHYWEYTTKYTTKMLSSLETIFGTCFGLDACEGLDTTANYILNLQSDQGIFNYGDGTQANYYVPELFYLSNKYGDESITSTMLSLNHGKMLDNENIVLSLLWYDTDISEDSVALPLDGVYETEGVASFRDAWSDGTMAFVGIHGGNTQVCHAQTDGGTFVYDYAGIRWAKELGSTPYDTSVSADYGVDGKRWLLYRSRAEAHNTIVINPDNSAGQAIDSNAKLIRFESENKGGIAVLDMSENYKENASSAVRGFFFTDDRSSLVVRDEISLTKDNSTVCWFMQTDAEVKIAEDGKSATLTQEGKQVTLEFMTTGNAEAKLTVEPSTRMQSSTSPITGGTTSSNSDIEDAAVNRIAIRLTNASGDVTITTKLTPAGVDASSVETYDTSIKTWKVAEGEIAAKPEVQKVVINGRELKFDSANQATFLCVEGKYDSVPEAIVNVDETKFTYEIANAANTKNGVTTIIVRNKENANAFATYTINFIEIPAAVVPEEERFAGMTALQVVSAEASDEPEANVGNVAWKVLDQDLSSKWTSQGLGNWILLELEKESIVDDLIILFKNGHLRSTYFNVSVSKDGVDYEQVYSGKSGGKAIGSAEAYEQFALGGKTAKYIRIDCNGNSAQGMVNGWNNIGEIVFTGTVAVKEPANTGTDTNTGTGTNTAPGNNDTAKPENGSDTTKDNGATSSGQAAIEHAAAQKAATGDASRLLPWGMLLLSAISGIIGFGVIRRKRSIH